MFEPGFNFMGKDLMEMMKESMQKMPYKMFYGGNGESAEIAETPARFFEMAMNAYEEQVSQIFKIPQFGLTRTYQDRMNQCLDEFNHLTMEMGRFSSLLAGPMGKAFAELEESQADLPDTPQSAYQQWIRILEKYYQELFSSPDFIYTLHRVLARYSTFQGVQNKLFNDLLKYTPVSSKEDFDEIAKDNYILKKELRQLKRKMEMLEEKVNQMMS